MQPSWFARMAVLKRMKMHTAAARLTNLSASSVWAPSHKKGLWERWLGWVMQTVCTLQAQAMCQTSHLTGTFVRIKKPCRVADNILLEWQNASSKCCCIQTQHSHSSIGLSGHWSRWGKDTSYRGKQGAQHSELWGLSNLLALKRQSCKWDIFMLQKQGQSGRT